MKALTICQPFASAIIEGIKTVENRTWKTKYRGKLIIQSGLSDKWIFPCSSMPAFKDFDIQNLTFGAIIGTVELVDIVFPGHESAPHSDPFVEGPYCWILENPVPLDKPIKCTGKQGLWNAPMEINNE